MTDTTLEGQDWAEQEAKRILPCPARECESLLCQSNGCAGNERIVPIVARALLAAEARGIERAAKWHDEKASAALKLARKDAGLKIPVGAKFQQECLSIANIHQLAAAALRALAVPKGKAG